LLDRHDDVANEDVEGGRLSSGSRQPLAYRPGDITQVELPGDDAGQLREAASESVSRGALVALHHGVPLERAEEPQRGGPVDVELPRDLGACAPAALGQQVEDGDRALHRADRELAPRLVAHCATLPLRVTGPHRKLL